MKATKIIALSLAVLLAAASLTGCGGTRMNGDGVEENQTVEASGGGENKNETVEPQSHAPETIHITFVSSPLNIPSIVERNHGIFAENFAEIGVKNVEYADLTSGADQTRALASGDIQFLYCVGATSVLLSAANGADIKIISMYSRSPEAFCLFSGDDAIQSPEDLRGKVVAGPQGTILHELLAAYLASGGMTIQDVEFVNTSIPNALAALSGGSADCALLAGAAAYNAQKSGIHLVTNGAGLVEAAICCAATQKFIDEYPDMTVKFLEAQQDVLDYIDANHTQAIEETAAFLDLDASAVEEVAAYYDFSMEIRDSDVAAMESTAAFMLDSGMIEEPVDVAALVIR